MYKVMLTCLNIIIYTYISIGFDNYIYICNIHFIFQFQSRKCQRLLPWPTRLEMTDETVEEVLQESEKKISKLLSALFFFFWVNHELVII